MCVCVWCCGLFPTVGSGPLVGLCEEFAVGLGFRQDGGDHESQSQLELLYEGLQNFAERRCDDQSRSVLVDMAEAAMVMAETETQPDDSTMAA